jgi:hypothetical protein
MELADIPNGGYCPLFRPVNLRSGVIGTPPLCGETIARIVKRDVERIGLNPGTYAGTA